MVETSSSRFMASHNNNDDSFWRSFRRPPAAAATSSSSSATATPAAVSSSEAHNPFSPDAGMETSSSRFMASHSDNDDSFWTSFRRPVVAAAATNSSPSSSSPASATPVVVSPSSESHNPFSPDFTPPPAPVNPDFHLDLRQQGAPLPPPIPPPPQASESNNSVRSSTSSSSDHPIEERNNYHPPPNDDNGDGDFPSYHREFYNEENVGSTPSSSDPVQERNSNNNNNSNDNGGDDFPTYNPELYNDDDNNNNQETFPPFAEAVLVVDDHDPQQQQNRSAANMIPSAQVEHIVLEATAEAPCEEDTLLQQQAYEFYQRQHLYQQEHQQLYGQNGRARHSHPSYNHGTDNHSISSGRRKKPPLLKNLVQKTKEASKEWRENPSLAARSSMLYAQRASQTSVRKLQDFTEKHELTQKARWTAKSIGSSIRKGAKYVLRKAMKSSHRHHSRSRRNSW